MVSLSPSLQIDSKNASRNEVLDILVSSPGPFVEKVAGLSEVGKVWGTSWSQNDDLFSNLKDIILSEELEDIVAPYLIIVDWLF